MRRTAAEALAGAGNSLVVSDLYRDNFDPVPGPGQFPSRSDPEYFDLMREQAHATATGAAAPDVVREQARVAWADVLLFQFPFWWWSMPAILKGWIDRVFANGFAYGERNLSGKAAMLCLTAETRASRFAGDAAYPILDPIEGGILRYCGLKVLPCFVAAEILSIGDEARRQRLDDFRDHLLAHIATIAEDAEAPSRTA